MKSFAPAFLLFIAVSFPAYAARNGIFECTLTEQQATASINEHLWGCAPDATDFHVRTAFVFAYNHLYQVPHWAAWHVQPDYLDTPFQASRWNAFQKDEEITNIADVDYSGWAGALENLVPGRLVPYTIAGGDRDNDGMDAEVESDLSVEDFEDACTVFEINSYSNVAPQYGARFSNPPGMWWFLETLVADMVFKGREFQVYAGTIFQDGERVQLIGPRRGRLDSNWEIGVPHGYFKIVIDPARMEAVGFLFDHQLDLANGCSIDAGAVTAPSDCIVPIEQIEEVTGLDFFNALSSGNNNDLRNASNVATWEAWLNNARRSE